MADQLVQFNGELQYAINANGQETYYGYNELGEQSARLYIQKNGAMRVGPHITGWVGTNDNVITLL